MKKNWTLFAGHSSGRFFWRSFFLGFVAVGFMIFTYFYWDEGICISRKGWGRGGGGGYLILPNARDVGVPSKQNYIMQRIKNTGRVLVFHCPPPLFFFFEIIFKPIIKKPSCSAPHSLRSFGSEKYFFFIWGFKINFQEKIKNSSVQ